MAHDDRIQAIRAQEFKADTVIRQSLSIYRHNFPAFFLLTLVVYSPVLVGLVLLAASDFDPMSLPSVQRANDHIKLFTWFQVAAEVVLHWVVVSSLIYGIVQELRGSPVSFGRSVTVGLSRALPVLAVALVVGFMTAVGYMLCIIPGIMLACSYWLAVPAAVVEGRGVGSALERSKALTEGLRNRIFTILVAIGILQVVSGMIIGAIEGGASSNWTRVIFFIGLRLFVTLLFGTWGAVAVAVGYYEVRRVKEGIDIERLAAVFD